jgi:hypothetical protein
MPLLHEIEWGVIIIVGITFVVDVLKLLLLLLDSGGAGVVVRAVHSLKQWRNSAREA